MLLLSKALPKSPNAFRDLFIHDFNNAKYLCLLHCEPVLIYPGPNAGIYTSTEHLVRNIFCSSFVNDIVKMCSRYHYFGSFTLLRLIGYIFETPLLPQIRQMYEKGETKY